MAQAQAEIKLIERHVTVLTITKIIVTLQQHDRHNDQQLDGWLGSMQDKRSELARCTACSRRLRTTKRRVKQTASLSIKIVDPADVHYGAAAAAAPAWL